MRSVARSGAVRAPWLAAMWRNPGFRLAVLTSLAARMTLEVVGLLVSAVVQPHGYSEQRFFTVPAPGPLLAPFEREDAVWYQHIAAAGYDIPQATAFMPLFPLLIRLLGAVIGSQGVASLLIPTLATAAALWLLYDLVVVELGAAAARRSVLLIALAPAAYFLWSPFTEGLFLLESVAVFWLARRGRKTAAGVVAGLAVLTRLQGILLLVPLIAYVVMQRRRGEERTSLRALIGQLVGASVPPLIALAALAVAFTTSAFNLGILGAQAEWGAHAAAPWTVLMASVSAIAGGHHPEELLNLVSVLAATAALPAMWRRLPAPYTLFTAASLLAIVCHTGGNTPLMSASRFVTVIFPLFMVLAAALTTRVRLRLVIAAFAGSCAMLFAAMVAYVFVA